MHYLQESLQKSLNTGFLNKAYSSKQEYRPEILSNDLSAGKNVLTTILNELESCDEFWISVAFITTS